MNSSEIHAIETRYSSGVYAKQSIAFVRGQGATLWDADGNTYLDCSSGHGVANLGHAHPKVAAAIAEQANTLITLFESFPNDKRALLMEKMGNSYSGWRGYSSVIPAQSRSRQPSSLLAFQLDAPAWWLLCAPSMAEHTVRFQPPSTRNIAMDLSHLCRILPYSV